MSPAERPKSVIIVDQPEIFVSNENNTLDQTMLSAQSINEYLDLFTTNLSKVSSKKSLSYNEWVN